MPDPLSPLPPDSDCGKKAIARIRLRQAQLTFYLAFISTALGSIVVIGAFIAGTQVVPITAALEVTTIACYRLAKDANDRLDKSLEESEGE